LQFEGRAVKEFPPPVPTWWPLFGGIAVKLADTQAGRGICACGEWSPELPSAYARQKWHKLHKTEVLTKRAEVKP
jgi:hypothetical protein